MRAQRRLQRKRAENVTIVDPEWAATEQVLGVFNAAGSLEDFWRLMTKREFHFAVFCLRKGSRILLRAPVGIDHELRDAGVDEMIESVGDQRTIRDRNERLWAMLCECLEARAETGAEDECLGNHSLLAANGDPGGKPAALFG